MYIVEIVVTCLLCAVFSGADIMALREIVVRLGGILGKVRQCQGRGNSLVELYSCSSTVVPLLCDPLMRDPLL